MFLENTVNHSEYSGWIEVICGSMFSGKTEELIRRLKRARIARQRVEIFKPAIDTRYDEQMVVSHDHNEIVSTPVSHSSEILLRATDVDVVGVDEAQFFDEGIVEVCNTLANSGIRVIVAGLDMDYLGRPFGPMPFLMATAEYVTKVHAVCTRTGNLAHYTHRLTGTTRWCSWARHTTTNPFPAKLISKPARPKNRKNKNKKPPMKNKIRLEGLRTYAFHGCLPSEALTGAMYSTDVEVETDFLQAARTDELCAGTIDYGQIARIVRPGNGPTGPPDRERRPAYSPGHPPRVSPSGKSMRAREQTGSSGRRGGRAGDGRDSRLRDALSAQMPKVLPQFCLFEKAPDRARPKKQNARRGRFCLSYTASIKRNEKR